MASVINRPNGHKWIQFRFQGKRKTLRLGKVSKSYADEISRHIRAIIIAKISGEPMRLSTARWLGDLTGKIRERLAANGLIEVRNSPGTIGGLVEYCMNEYRDGEETTRDCMQYACNKLTEYFGRTMELEAFTFGDAEDFRRSMRRNGYAETTVSNVCTRAKRLFNMALDKEWVSRNPFNKMRGWTKTNTDRQTFVTRPMIDNVLKVCDNEWALIVTLIRYGGLRAPSEVLDLKWEYISWELSRMQIYSSKNAHNAGKWRTAPIWPEIKPYLDIQWERAEKGEVYIIRGHRNQSGRKRANRALYSAFKKRVITSGVTPWPKLFINLRSTRETELCEEYPIHVVTQWLGNSPTVARKHYLQVQEKFFEQAVSNQASKCKS